MPFKSIAFVKSTALGLLAAALLAPSASALSCARPDIAQTMEQVKASEDLYYILVGTFTSPKLPKTKKPRSPNAPMNGVGAHTVEAWFDGRMLSNNARYDTPVTRMPVDVDVTCAGPWCGSAPANGQEMIAFVKVRPGQPMVLDAGACPNKVYRLHADKKQIETLRSCFDKSCAAETDSRFDRR